MKNLENLPIEVQAELAWMARKARAVHPRGTFDSAKRFFPDEASEGGTPSVRKPSRKWPFSYMLGCRTRAWCAQLPAATRLEDAAAGARLVVEGRVRPSKRLQKALEALGA